jgi:type IV pilus assembly protein PilB
MQGGMKKLWNSLTGKASTEARPPGTRAAQRGVAEVEMRLAELRAKGVTLSPAPKRSVPALRSQIPEAPAPPAQQPESELPLQKELDLEMAPDLEVEASEAVAERAPGTQAVPAPAVEVEPPAPAFANPSQPPVRVRRPRIGEMLLERHLVTQAQLDQALKAQRETGQRIGTLLVQQGAISKLEFFSTLADQHGVEVLQQDRVEIDPSARDVLPVELIQRHGVVPLWANDKILRVAMADPHNVEIIDELRFKSGRWIQVVLADEDRITELIQKSFSAKSAVGDALADAASFDVEEVKVEGEREEEPHTAYELLQESSDRPVINLVNHLLKDSMRRRASDVHIEPYETTWRVRYRVDGELQTIMSPPQRLHVPVVSRIKVMSGMDISKRRVPQDGHLVVKYGGQLLHYRVSSLPTVYGEKCVLRLLTKEADLADLERIGMEKDELLRLRRAISAPQGLVLVTGPTGSGKTTTVHAALNAIAKPTINVTTLEDPVEVTLPGINHVQITEKSGLSFADALRSLLRQDPDVVFVGEMRDAEVSTIAIRASLTGHLVMSTLHTNSALEAFDRLDDMGVERYLVAATIQTVVAQRLLRRVCAKCVEPAGPADFQDVMGTAEMLEKMARMGLNPELKKGKGCDECMGTGYRRRLAVYEVLPIDRQVRELIRKKVEPEVLLAAVSQRSYRTLYENGLRQCAQGQTTLAEVQRVLAQAD